MSQLPCMGRWGIVANPPTCLVLHLPMHFFNAQTMSKEEMQQQILDAITSGKIQVTNINFGDHVEHQHKIEKVEAGGVGFQIFGASKTDMPQPKQESSVNNILPIPPKGKYTKVREYIAERCRFDQEFKHYVDTHTRVDLCKRLTNEFGWDVDEHHLGVNMNRNR